MSTNNDSSTRTLSESTGAPHPQPLHLHLHHRGQPLEPRQRLHWTGPGLPPHRLHQRCRALQLEGHVQHGGHTGAQPAHGGGGGHAHAHTRLLYSLCSGSIQEHRASSHAIMEFERVNVNPTRTALSQSLCRHDRCFCAPRAQPAAGAAFKFPAGVT
jgi:hypothetical protein